MSKGDIMTVGQRIKEARKEQHMTQKQLADKLGVSYVVICQYENGARNPKNETLGRIANALGIPITDLLFDENSEIMQKFHQTTEKPNRAPVSDDDLMVALFGGNDDVTEEMWEEVKRFAEFVKNKNKK